MRIAINSMFLQRPESGSGQHLFHLLKGLDENDRDNQYVLLSPRFRHSSPGRVPHLSKRFEHVEIASPVHRLGPSLESLWWEQAGIVAACRRENVALLHSPYFTAPLALPAPTVTTVHDVIPLVMPAYRQKLKSRLYSSLVSLAARRANAIITVSEYSKKDIMRVLRIPDERIHVIGNAVDESYRPVSDPRVIGDVRARYGIAEKYLLYFGGFDVRKNVDRVVLAYAALPSAMRSAHQLVIAGRLPLFSHPTYTDPRPLIRQLGLDEQVIVTGAIDEPDKPPLYSGATAYLFPSLYEGFGITVLEAMACGATVITSNSSSLPEVAGNAACYVDPYDVPAISQAIERLVDDQALRDELGQRGIERARHFSWTHIAQQTIEVYRSL